MEFKRDLARLTELWRRFLLGQMWVCFIFWIGTDSKLPLQIDQSLTIQKKLPVGTIGADGSEAFKSKLKFQIQHEVFRLAFYKEK